jgi:hypothetical protein
MNDEYSLYDAKANFSKIVKRVREGDAYIDSSCLAAIALNESTAEKSVK